MYYCLWFTKHIQYKNVLESAAKHGRERWWVSPHSETWSWKESQKSLARHTIPKNLFVNFLPAYLRLFLPKYLCASPLLLPVQLTSFLCDWLEYFYQFSSSISISFQNFLVSIFLHNLGKLISYFCVLKVFSNSHYAICKW